ncbi:MAG TPA: hypothetical protein PLE35_09865, partial [Lentisphaeria bacterium]|nr:hypothetical protein [Lentisphaeria bacterium]
MWRAAMKQSNKSRWAYLGSFFLVLGCCLYAADTPKIIFAPRDSVYATDNVQLWAVLPGPRQQLHDWQYRWELTPGNGVVVTTPAGTAVYADFIDDSRNLCCPTDIELADGQGNGVFGLRLQVTNAEGQVITQEKTLRVLADSPPGTSAELEERRQDAICRGLHWLMLVQSADGCWCPFLLDESQRGQHRTSSTACALWAFGNCGYGLSRQQNNPFVDVVLEGIEFLLRESDIV